MNALAAHALWAEEYDHAPNPLLALEKRIVLSLLPELSGRVAADVACGTGRWAREFCFRGARVVAADRCREMAARTTTLAVIADASRLPLPDSFADLSICAFAFSYTGPCLEELARITRPSGTVIVTDMHPRAVEAGWTRSFRTRDQGRVTIDTEPYTLASLVCDGLRLETLVEAPFGEPEQGVFARAGRPDLLEQTRDMDAIYVAKWVRQC